MDRLGRPLTEFQQHPVRCPLHGGLRHALSECRAMEHICRDADSFGFFRKAKWQLSNNGNSSNPSNSHPSPAPPPTVPPTPAPTSAPASVPTDSARMASVLTAIDAFSARFDKIEENLQAFGEASEVDSGIDNDNNSTSLPYFKPN